MNHVDVRTDSMSGLLATLLDSVPGAAHAVLATATGLPICISAALPTERAEQLAGIGAGLVSVADGAGRVMTAGNPTQIVVEMSAGVLLATPVTDRVGLIVLAAVECDRQALGFEVAQFTENIQPMVKSLDG